ncbi:methyl-accepting chemotaxis protein [Sphingomonas sp. RB3P16]|uniref:methyl-accepting chemotaxis protein n=1 Tax=Parasphingomonas frigoris TaxID=3096163 RepID=UPI002FCBF235
MKILQNAKISIKIVSLLLFLGAITLLIAWNGSSQLSKADTAYSGAILSQQDTTKLVRANRNTSDMLYSSYRALVYDGNSKAAHDAAAAEQASFAAAKKNFAEVIAAEPETATALNKFVGQLDDIHGFATTAARYGLANQDAAAAAELARADSEMQSYYKGLVEFNNARSESANATSTRLSAEAATTSFWIILIALIGVAGGIGLAVVITRYGITGPLSRLQTLMGEIAAGNYRNDVVGTDRGDEVGAMAKAVCVFRENGLAKEAGDKAKARADAEQKLVVDTISMHLSELSGGDLTAVIKVEFPEDYAVLKSNFNEAMDNLRDLIGAVGESATAIQTGSGEIAQASEDLARRTEGNAASLEETAAAITQIDSRLKASATAASRTVERADQAIHTVGGGRAVADEAVQAMGRVSDSAKGIDSVIEGLDKIAFQTRVLAMNAAVEAGRAGDAGRGFAVVADLVSALAMRAEEEAKRARDQLTVTQTDIGIAVQAVVKVDGALTTITSDVGQVHELLGTMAADNQAQSAAITQISAAISDMDKSTQQNAAMVEETSAAARNLAGEVNGLSQQAARFNVGKTAATNRSNPMAKGVKTSAKVYASPIKPLPAAAVAAMVRPDSDWASF